MEIVEQCGRERDITQSAQLYHENLTRMPDAGRLHSGLRHSFAYCTNA